MNDINLLLLHGALGGSIQFQPLVPLLEDYCAIHTLDFEGHGSTPLRDRPFRFSHFAENVIDFLDHRSIETAHIFGHSMGGHVGLYLARFFPHRIQSVFCLGTKFFWTPEIALKENTMLNPEKMKAKVPHFVQTLQARHTASGWEILTEKIKDQHLFLAENNPLEDEDLGHISQRVRIGRGDRDKMVSLEESVWAYNLLPNAELQIFPATPHPLEQISMTRLSGAIVDFLIG